MELTVISIISLFELNKVERQDFITRVVDQIDHLDPLKLHVQVKNMEKIVEGLTENQDYKRAVLDAAGLQGQKKFEYLNSTLEIKEVGVKYDYTQTGDLELFEWQTRSAELAEKIKQRQKLLQTVPVKGMIITNEETAETYTVYPPSKSSTTAVQCTLK